SRLGDGVLWAPLTWLGNSHHHLDFAGTLSASPRLYLDLLGDLLENLITHGFRRLVLLNGHGGNIVPASQAVFEVRQRHRDRSAPGHIGIPGAGTAEKGEVLFRTFSDHVVAFLERIKAWDGRSWDG